MFAGGKYASWAGVLAALLVGGCARQGSAPPRAAASLTSAQVESPAPTQKGAELAAAVRAEDDDPDDDPRGILVIDPDVVSQCSSMRALRVESGDTMAWLKLLKSVARCMNEGELRDRVVVLRGPARPQVIVKYILSRLGVREERVDLSDDEGASCVDDACDGSDLRVDVGLSAAPPTITHAL